MIVIALYTIFVFRSGMKEQPAVLDEYEEFARMSGHTPTRIKGSDGGLVLAGGAGLLLGGYAINQSAVFVATAMGISEMTIGLTVVAIGTSLPELATSVVAALRKEADIAVGNVIGANICNIAAVLGLSGIVAPLSISPSILTEELPAVLLISLVSWPVCRSGWAIRRWEGAILLGVYGGLAYWLIF
jgi:cation:H+ antiporter